MIARKSKITLTWFSLSLMAPSSFGLSAKFDQTLSLQGITFKVVSSNGESPSNNLRIEPQGLKGDNRPIEQEIEGKVTGAEIADLNVDGSPEIYVYVRSATSKDEASLIAYAANHKKSLTEIYLAPLKSNPKAFDGYAGHDEFAVIENSLARRYPIFKTDADGQARATGKMRQIQYKLKPGEAGWLLKIKRIDEF